MKAMRAMRLVGSGMALGVTVGVVVCGWWFDSITRYVTAQ